MAISLASIVRGRQVKAPRILVYGVNGIGKSTFASQAANPIFIPAEDGLGILDVARFPKPESFDDIMQAIRSLAEGKHEYETVVIDTLDEVERLIFLATAKAGGKNNIEEFGYGKGYVLALDNWQKVIDGLDILREQNIVSLLIAHSTIKAFNSPDSEPYDRYRLDLHEKSASLLRDWADIILFANYKVFTRKAGEKKSDPIIGAGTGERIIYTEERPAHWAKNRFGLPYEMPFDYSTFWEALTAATAEPKTAKKAK